MYNGELENICSDLFFLLVFLFFVGWVGPWIVTFDGFNIITINSNTLFPTQPLPNRRRNIARTLVPMTRGTRIAGYFVAVVDFVCIGGRR